MAVSKAAVDNHYLMMAQKPLKPREVKVRNIPLAVKGTDLKRI